MGQLTDEKAVLENMVAACREVEDERNVGVGISGGVMSWARDG